MKLGLTASALWYTVPQQITHLQASTERPKDAKTPALGGRRFSYCNTLMKLERFDHNQ